ncbi:dehydrogenase/reductase SDR family member on chromosome X [Coccinella septempunctata]|uniref:dehydrogenase/reductase SDR family member on chromosome X n=1 Tax=Coccinella septempunctata TaxID=41139 RepID=UPI001D099892|nr:dehydrogenase/reductase SDR family member on chromosome X [Coccinella septempunctata]
MIIICGCLVIIIATAIAIVRSKKPMDLIMAEAKYEMMYNAMGSRALLQDWMMRKDNKTDLLPQPGKIAVITGGARGIGAEVVKMLMKCDITVVIGCRNVQAAEMMLKKYRDEGLDKGDIDAFQLDISYLDSVRNFAATVTEKYPKINYLINNAGIMFGPRIETRDGYESQFATNYLGHFLLTHLLFDSLKKAGDAKCNSRIVNVSSCAHLAGAINFDDINYRSRYITSEAYAQSKLAQILFTNYLYTLCKNEGHHIQLHSIHPGIVNTELFDGTNLKNLAPWLPNLMFKNPEQGAIPIVHACLSPELEGKGGTYIHNCRIFPTSELAQDEELQKKLFDFTKTLIGIEHFGVTT